MICPCCDSTVPAFLVLTEDHAQLSVTVISSREPLLHHWLAVPLVSCFFVLLFSLALFYVSMLPLSLPGVRCAAALFAWQFSSLAI